MKYSQSSNGNLLPNEMNIQLNVFSTTILHWICRHVYGRDVVTVNDGGIESFSFFGSFKGLPRELLLFFFLI